MPSDQKEDKPAQLAEHPVRIDMGKGGTPLDDYAIVDLLPREAIYIRKRGVREGEVYIGRGSRKDHLEPSEWHNPFKMIQHLNDRATVCGLFKDYLDRSPQLQSRLPTRCSKVLVCHCQLGLQCHRQVLIGAVRDMLMNAGTTHLGQVATAAASEFFAGSAKITAQLQALGMRTTVPFERSQQERDCGISPEKGLSDPRVIDAILKEIRARRLFYGFLEVPCETMTRLRDRPPARSLLSFLAVRCARHGPAAVGARHRSRQ